MLHSVEIALLRRVWFPVARLEDVAPGPAPARLLDQELVVFQSDTGSTITVADGQCPHRWANLAHGVAVGGEIECPYHGWRFDGRGVLTAVPSLAASAALPHCSLRTFRSRVAYGLVWAVLDEPFLPFPDLPGLPATDWSFIDHPDLPYYEIGDWHVAWGEAVWLHAGMRAVHENFADMSHFAFVHRASMGDVGPVIPAHSIEATRTSLSYRLRNLPSGSVEADPQPIAEADLAAIMLQRTNDYTVLFPSTTTIVSRSAAAGARFVAQLVSPTSTDGEHVRSFWCAALDSTMRASAGVSIIESFAYDNRVTNEDYPILEASRPREQPLTARGQVHTRADAASIAYRKMYRHLLAAFAMEHGFDDPTAAEHEESHD